MYKRLHIVFLFICVFSFAGKTQPDTSLFNRPLDELLQVPVKNNGVYTQSVFESLVSSVVIDREMIERYNFQSVAEAVQTVAGIMIYRTYLSQNLPTSRGLLQTHYPNKVLILINGIPSWFSMTNEGFLDRININDVEKIEVLRGPASVTYGTNAYSGAINIVLKNVSGNSLNSSMQVGNAFTIEAATNYTYIHNKWKFFVSASSKRQNGFKYHFTGEDSIPGYLYDRFNVSNFTFEASYKSHTFLFNAFDLDGINFGPRLSFETGAGKPARLYGYLASYKFQRKINNVTFVSHDFSVDWNVRDLAINYALRRDVIFEGYRFSDNMRFNRQLGKSFSFNAGTNIEYRYSTQLLDIDKISDSVISYTVGNSEYNVYNNGLYHTGVWETAGYVQLKYVSKRLSFLLGYRLTYNKVFNINNSFTGTLIYSLPGNNSIKLFYGDSYRSPSLFETNLIYPVVLGNPNLKPETGNTLELSFMHQGQYFHLQVLGYISQYNDLIVRQLQDTILNGYVINNINIYENGDKLLTSGVEVEMNYNNPQVGAFFVNYAFLHGLENADKYYLNFVPKHTVTAGLSRDIGAFSMSTVFNFWSSVDAPVEPIGSQWWLDLNLSLTLKSKRASFVHRLSAKNLFNREVLIPEYVRQNINSLPAGYYRYISYTFQVKF